MTTPAAHGPTDARAAAERVPNRVQRFAVVGVIATLVDLAVLVPLIRRWGFDAFTADLVSVSIATVVSLLLHRLVTLANSPTRRWFEDYVGSYLTTLVGSLAVDVVVSYRPKPVRMNRECLSRLCGDSLDRHQLLLDQPMWMFA